MVTSELELARQAQAEISEQQRRAARLPELEAQEAKRVELQNAAAGEARAKEDLDDILIDYARRKSVRDNKTDKLLKQFSLVVQDGQSFGQLCRSVQKHARDTAYYKLVRSVGRENMDNDLVRAHGEQILMDKGLWPLSQFKGDKSDASKALLQALGHFVDIVW